MTMLCTICGETYEYGEGTMARHQNAAPPCLVARIVAAAIEAERARTCNAVRALEKYVGDEHSALLRALANGIENGAS